MVPPTRAPPAEGVERRERRDGRRDPAGGRILVLLIPEGHRLPEKLEEGAWRVFLRFARR